MIGTLLSYFPAHTHPLTLVSDPDRLLSGEGVLKELIGRGFRILCETDPVVLRQQVEAARPFSTQQPLLLISSGVLEALPYDLYQPAHRLSLSLHQFFPTLAYGVLKTLSPEQVERLAVSPPPAKQLSWQKTCDYLLNQVFDASPVRLCRSAGALVEWLSSYHHRRSRMPDELREHLLMQLRSAALFSGWDLERLLSDEQAFAQFLQQEWQQTLQQQLKQVGEAARLPFAEDAYLQDLLPGLVRRGLLQPLQVTGPAALPGWASPGITALDESQQRLAQLLAELRQAQPDSWKDWQRLAEDWAELSNLMQQPGLTVDGAQQEAYQALCHSVDAQFANWLQANYSALGAQRLPTPHHVHHVPHCLAYLHSLGKLNKAVLLVLDGLSLSDWRIVQAAWAKRHPAWQMRNEPLLAQVPTLTTISRRALISGLRPAEFLGLTTLSEERAWSLFWQRQGIIESACKLLPLAYDRQVDQLPELRDERIHFWCLVDDTPDKLTHHATLGAADQQSSLRLWLEDRHEPNTLQLEAWLDDFLERGFAVFLTSDHGHVQATGWGQAAEGLLAQTRGRRARIYDNVQAAARVQVAFAQTWLWAEDGLLPSGTCALMPKTRHAFANAGEVLVTHGGISLEEVLVPFVQIRKES